MRDEGRQRPCLTFLIPHPSSLPSIDLLQQPADRFVELAVAALLPLAEGAVHVEVDRPAGSLQVLAGKTLDRDPRQAEVIIETSEYIRCELDEAARREMVVKLEDFLRRRSKIAQVVREEEIRAAPGLREACRILFGAEAEEKIAEYFAPERAFPPSRKRPATA